MSLEDVLEDFLSYKKVLDDLDRNETESSTVETYEKQFMKLRDVGYRYKLEGFCTSVEGEKRQNSSRNRYKDIVPHDQTRVKLLEPSGDPPSDYINASFIKGVYPGQAYIAAQGAMPDTVVDFWKMLWENDVKTVVMACNEYEGIPRKLRCQRYWAIDTKETLEIGDVSVTLVKEQKGNYNEFVIRHLKATRRGETRELTHLHYTEFPDRGIPKCVPSLLDMIELMRELQPANSPDAPPIVIHCSAGCGRTGTIIVLDYIWNMLKCGKVKQGFSIFDVIGEMRKQRMAIVQSLEQYVFVHDAVSVMFTRHLNLMQEHSDYYNITPRRPTALVNAVSSEYELLALHEPSVDKSKPGTPPTPTAKPRSHLGSSEEAASQEVKKPDYPHRTSDSGPSAVSKPGGKSSYQGASAQDTSVAIYSTPFCGPAVVVTKPNAGTAAQNFHQGTDISKASKPTLPGKSFTGRNSQEYPGISSSHSSSSLNSMTGMYAEITNQPKSPANGKSPSPSPSPYEYANPDPVGKWSLQHIARGQQPVECEYATIPLEDPQYSCPDWLPEKTTEHHYSDSEDTHSPLPPKPANNPPVDSSGISAGDAFAFIKKVFTKPTPDLSTFQSTGGPAHVLFRKMDISYPNRVPRPKYGKRPLNTLSVK